MSPDQLRGRWSKDVTAALATLLYQGKLEEIEQVSGRESGWIDLRGLTIGKSIKKPMLDVDFSFGRVGRGCSSILCLPMEHCRMTEFDFGKASLEGRVLDSVFDGSRIGDIQAHCEHCTFDGATLTGYVGNGRTMRGNTFKGAVLRRCGMAITTYERCDFSGATITANLTQATFVSCVFEGAAFKQCLLDDTVFEACRAVSEDSFTESTSGASTSPIDIRP